MTTNEIIDYYANLLILQYAKAPRAYATIQALVKPVIMDQLPVAVQNAFGVDTAVGKQLDVIGKYMGVTRYGNDFAGNAITLTDSDFRQLIKFAIIRNNGGTSLADIQSLIHVFFPGDFLVFDYTNMQMSYFFSTAIGSQQLAEMLVIQGLLPKPMAVGIGSLIYAPYVSSFFGMSSYSITSFQTYDSTVTYHEGDVVQYGSNPQYRYFQAIVDNVLGVTPAVGPFWKYYSGNNAKGFNTYADYQTTWTWMRYSYAIVI